MEKLILDSIAAILKKHPALLKIALRQKAKFEGWLKFELAAHLEKMGMQAVAVETVNKLKRHRADITFQQGFLDQ